MPGICTTILVLSTPLSELSCAIGGGSGGGGCLSLRKSSTVTPKSSAICCSRTSSGVRLPVSQGDHYWGETFLPMCSENPAVQFLPPPQPGYFFILQARIFRAIVARNSSGIFPMSFAHQRKSPCRRGYPPPTTSSPKCKLPSPQGGRQKDQTQNSVLLNGLAKGLRRVSPVVFGILRAAIAAQEK